MDGVAVVALTGWGQDQDRRRTQQAGIDHHITKPMDLARLQALIGECVATRRLETADPPERPGPMPD
jgi:CheY-like chemotaxis protein